VASKNWCKKTSKTNATIADINDSNVLNFLPIWSTKQTLIRFRIGLEGMNKDNRKKFTASN
jgi:hypothetical protein